MQVPHTRRQRNSLSETVILDVAEKILRSGTEPLTIRRIAQELQCSNMALYRYFGTKELLESALLDRVLSRLELPSQTQAWRDALRELAVRHKQLLEENRWAIPLLFSNPLPGLAAVHIGESMLGILSRGGIVGERAVTVFVTILALNYGWAGFSSVKHEAVIGGQKNISVEEALLQLSSTSFPLTRAAAAYFVDYGNEQQYQHALEVLIGSLGSV